MGVLASPYQLVKTCACDPAVEPGNLPATADLQRKAYTTINWCVSNGPTRVFEKHIMDNCASISADTLESYADFYVNQYMPSCGYSWKTAKDIPAKNNVVNENTTQQSLNSSRDPFAERLLQCASSKNMLGVAAYPNMNALFSELQ